MTYQDKWGHGRVIEKGYRECASRYEIVRRFCAEFFGDSAFTVRDIGANLCYFGLRLTEDFPACKIRAYEGHNSVVRAAEKHLAKYGNTRLELAAKFLIPDELHWSACDLTLALSVFHHVKEPLSYWLAAIQRTSKHAIVELAVEQSARNSIRKPTVPEGAKILGYGESHLEDAKRPIFYLEGK